MPQHSSSSHAAHVTAEASGPYDPGAHATHVPPPFVAVPSGHGVHADAASDPEGDVKPGAQRVHGALQSVQPPAE